jgi:phosphatidylinositol-3,4,5-trisphosphate 3-phosphatase/dual-specificity protein phosphatase PTEN
MNYIRTLVSGKKKRFVDRKYNLDLSYITPRIIAMAYPGSGLETVYRNSIDQVSNFLKERHKGNYLVMNLSGRKYDNNKFENKVKIYLRRSKNTNG